MCVTRLIRNTIIKAREKMRNCLLFNLTVHVLLTGRNECVRRGERDIYIAVDNHV